MNDGPNIIINWTEPANNGAVITRYTISILESDGSTFTEDVTNCDGSDSTIMAARSCTIPITSLIVAPYSLVISDGVYAKISATNEKGTSAYSSQGNGGMIISAPDAPINLAENISDRTTSTLGITWSPGAFNGGFVILDYRVSFKEQGESTW